MVSAKRVVHKDGRHGVVLEENDENTHVHWGTSSQRDTEGNTVEQPFTEWVPNRDLELCPDPVFYGDGAKKGMVYDPKDFK